jgi:hypothetical protein
MRSFILAFILLSPAAAPAQQGPATKIVQPPGPALVLTNDATNQAVILKPADIKAMDHVTVSVHNAHANADQTYSGVPLAALLAKLNAPLGDQLHGKAMTTGFVARGSDGYEVLLSLAEVDPAFHGGDVIVADTLDGKPIEKNGPIQLVVTEDKRPARWVRNLVSISLVEIH